VIGLPDAVEAMADRGPDWAAWVRRLPHLVEDVLSSWQLRPAAPPQHGNCSLVLPVRGEDAEHPASMLKFGFVEPESELEHLALQRWAGDGAVRLLRADPRRGVLLLERLGRRDLADVWDLEACEIVAGFYDRLHAEAGPRFRRLSAECERWAEQLRAVPRDAPLPRRLVEQAASALRTFAADAATDGRLIHTDLHFANVLSAEREPWIVIDPKPLSGDPAFEIAPLLWNRWEEMSDDFGAGIRRRFLTVVDAAGLDEDRARAWVVVRMVLNAAWDLHTADRGWLTQCITVAKAV